MRKHPTQIFLRLDVDDLATPDHAVKHGRDPAGLRMPNENVIFPSALCGTEEVLHPVVLDLDLAVSELGVEGDLESVDIGIVDGSFELAEPRRRVAVPQIPKLSLDAFDSRLRLQMPQAPTLLVLEIQVSALILGRRYLVPHNVYAHLTFALAMVGLLLIICYKKEEPSRWRRGDRD